MKKISTSITQTLVRLILSIGILWGLSTTVFANGKIGFACGYAGSPTESVVLIDSLVKSKDYNKIISLLKSNDDGVKCLAVIVCEILDSNEKIKLTDKDKKNISDAYNSKEKINICSGCTYYAEPRLSDILNEVDFDDWGFNMKKIAKERYIKLIE